MIKNLAEDLNMFTVLHEKIKMDVNLYKLITEFKRIENNVAILTSDLHSISYNFDINKCQNNNAYVQSV